MTHIGIVEDNEDYRSTYSEFLAAAGYEVTAFPDRASAIEHFDDAMPDLFLLDIELQDDSGGGLRLAEHFRERSETIPIVMLTGFSGEEFQTLGYRAGADDYVTKDMSLNHVLFRIETLIKRIEALRGSEPAGERSDFAVGPDLRFDELRKVIYWKGEPVELSLTKYLMVEAVARGGGEVVGYDDIMEHARIVVERSTLLVHVHQIRSKFKDVDENFDCLKTHHGRGLRWCPD